MFTRRIGESLIESSEVIGRRDAAVWLAQTGIKGLWRENFDGAMEQVGIDLTLYPGLLHRLTAASLSIGAVRVTAYGYSEQC